MTRIFTHNKITRNPFLIFLPFLLYYIFYVIKHHTDVMIGDENRYYQYAQNLLHGFYSPPPPEIYLWNGPGYPIFLMPFVYFKTPLILITLTNALLQFLSVIFLFKSIKIVSNFKMALIFSLFWAISFGAYAHMQSILTESFSYFLISLLIYYSILSFRKQKKKYVLITGFILGYIALTKIIFGYIILVILIGSFVLWLIKKRKSNYQTSLIIGTIALITTLPYLIYTKNLTGKNFYWGNSGGMSLYWMSMPYEKEYGDWQSENFTANNPALSKPEHQKELSKNHRQEMENILQYKGVARDEAFINKALENIQKHPKKYVKNIFYNISRMLFNTPNSYAYQNSTKLVWHSGFLLLLIIISLLLTIIYRKQIENAIWFLMIIAVLYIGTSALVSADYRLFSPIIPVLLLWIAYVLKISKGINKWA